MLIIRERSGDTLVGAVDGANTSYSVSLDYIVGSVTIFLNGVLNADFSEVPPRGITLDNPPLEGDALAVEYHRIGPPAGGADGGVPAAPQIIPLVPDGIISDLRPTVFVSGVEE